MSPQRVSQLDARRLDDELHALFITEAKNVLRFLPASHVDSILPELTALLRLVFVLNTTAVQKPTPGESLHALNYRHLSKWQRALFVLADVILPYTWGRLRRISISNNWAVQRRRASRLLGALESLARFAVLVNLLAFFRNGKYRTLSDRLVGGTLYYTRRIRGTPPAFEFVNSQLVWQGVAEGALLMAPLVSGGWIRRLGKRILGWGGRTEAIEGERVCGVCGAEPVMPHVGVPCGHLVCYVCSGGGGVCAVCGAGQGVERVTFG